MVKKFKAKIVSCKEVAQATYEVVFNALVEDFNFTAGQYFTISIPELAHLPIPKSTHDFSIASSPDELPNFKIAFRVSNSAFKQHLLKCEQGAEVNVKGPKGVSHLPESGNAPLVFIAGGIGITPFLSMATYVGENKLKHKITVLYYNYSKERAAYLEELEQLAGKTENISVEFIYGRMDGTHIQKYISNTQTIWYIAGPPGMVKAAQAMLSQKGVKNVNIKTDEFSGYKT